nr:hypothetical protein [uncultured Rhodoferax sp.]
MNVRIGHFSVSIFFGIKVMRHVVGLSSAQGNEQRWPLDVEHRMRFDSDSVHSLGYFQLLSPAFDHYAQRDAGAAISFINVMFCLDGHDLAEAAKILTQLEITVSAKPQHWREFLGTSQRGKEEPTRIEPRLFRSRAIALLAGLRTLVQIAMAQRKCVVYGNGVCYRHLCGIKLPLGTVEYS